jgi:hypothetical protein
MSADEKCTNCIRTDPKIQDEFAFYMCKAKLHTCKMRFFLNFRVYTNWHEAYATINL